jgi:5-methylcytosine-specific restriction endonuclease McrA
MYVACTWLRKLGDNVSVDHIIPLVRGGLHIFWNLRIIPRGANCKKHARPATEDELEICRLWLETESAF